jgi:hypothetical protein
LRDAIACFVVSVVWVAGAQVRARCGRDARVCACNARARCATATDGNLECIIIGHSQGPGADTSLVLYLQPLTGADLKPKQQLSVKLVQAALAPLATKSHAQIVVAMDAQQGVHVFPDTDETRQLVAAKSGSIFFYLTEVGSSAMKGYVMIAQKRGQELSAKEAWTVVLPKSEAITALAPHNTQEAIRSAGRVLGNRAVLLKYINANSLAVATESVSGEGDSQFSSSSPNVGAKEPCVRVYLVDAVTGAIIHNVVHKDAKGPVRLVQTENTLVYNYWNNRKQRFEISVLELYENNKQEILTAGQVSYRCRYGYRYGHTHTHTHTHTVAWEQQTGNPHGWPDLLQM